MKGHWGQRVARAVPLAVVILLGVLLLLVESTNPPRPSTSFLTPTASPAASVPASSPSAPATSKKVKLYFGLFGGGSGDKKNKGPPSSADEEKLRRAIANCKKCGGKGALDCPVCSGTGIDRKGGNVFERMKCMKCQGFGYVSCESCNPGGLTPEQRGER